jgi:hypothetical protein
MSDEPAAQQNGAPDVDETLKDAAVTDTSGPTEPQPFSWL